MEKKNLLHSERSNVKNRTYYFDLREGESGEHFLVISQTKADEEGVTGRVKMVLFEEDLNAFSQCLMRSLFFFQQKGQPLADRAYIAEVRKEHPNAFRRWTKEEEELLKDLYQQGHSVKELMVHFKRNEGGIIKRLELLGIAVEAPAA